MVEWVHVLFQLGTSNDT